MKMSEEIKPEFNYPANAAKSDDILFEDFFLESCIISTSLDEIQKTCLSNEVNAQERHNQFLNLINSHLAENNSLKNYINIIAECQKKTAELANNQFERLMLNPAIETIFMLCLTLKQLCEQAQHLSGDEGFCQLANSITETLKLAESKAQYLGIEEIAPLELDDFNSNEHEIKQTVETDDEVKHKKIKQTLKPGIKSHERIFRPAIVAVYRFIKH